MYYQAFLDTRPIKKDSSSNKSISNIIAVSYYDFAEKRMEEIKENLFWQGEKHDTTSITQD